MLKLWIRFLAIFKRHKPNSGQYNNHDLNVSTIVNIFCSKYEQECS